MKPAPAPRLLLVGLSLLLSGCVETETPAPAPVLSFERLDATTTRALLTPAPALPLRWTVEPSPDCGNDDRTGESSAGEWPANAPSVDVRAWAGHLFTVEAGGVKVSDCVPPLSWNSPQSVPTR